MTTAPADLTSLAGLRWSRRGYAALSGQLLELFERVDGMFVALAREFAAEPIAFPTFLPAAELQRVDYFGSFPHLATFPVHLPADDAALAGFAAEPLDAGGAVRLPPTDPVVDVLTPAACYHLYAHHRGETFAAGRRFTTRAVCYRREAEYRPLERQWAFSMREIVCIGTGDEARAFLDLARDAAGRAAAAAGLPVRWEHATDPFFRPSRNPQYLMQRLDPTKHELVFGADLAIGSTNLHHDHFGRAFDIERAGPDGSTPATTACVAFGVERWVAAIVRQHGTDPTGWPSLEVAS